MLLTIAVCTYRRFDWLEKCLHALNCQTLERDKYQVLIIDNSLDFANSRIFKDSLECNFNYEYVITEKKGLSSARNIAIEMCTSSYIAFLDDDAIPDPFWAESILDVFDRNECAGVVGGRVDPIWEMSRPQWLTNEFEGTLTVLDWGEEQLISDNQWLVGANVAYSVQALAQTTGFNESLGRNGELLLCHEELALNQQIQQLGYDVLFSPKPRVRHLIQKERMVAEWFCRQAYWESVSRAFFYTGFSVEGQFKKLESFFCSRINKYLEDYKVPEESGLLEQEIKKFSSFGWRDAATYGVDTRKSRVPLQAQCVYIVTPCLNAVKTIERTILSVFTQSGNFRIRYHVVDGGSTDGTLEVLHKCKNLCEQYQDSFPNQGILFSFESEKDDGLYDAVAKGFSRTCRHAESAMTWINADDYLFPTACADVLNAFSIDTVCWVCGHINCHKKDLGTIADSSCNYPVELLKAGLCDGIHWPTVQQEGTFWKSKLWEKTGGVNTSLTLCGDWDLWQRFACESLLFALPCSTGSFQVRFGQLSSSVEDYQREVDSIISLKDRRRSLDRILRSCKPISYPEVFFDRSVGFRVGMKTLSGTDIPDCSQKWFRKFLLSVPKESCPVEDNVSQTENNVAEDFMKCSHEAGKTTKFIDLPCEGSATGKIGMQLINAPILHKIYQKSPKFLQSLLTSIKYRFLLDLINLPQNLRNFFVIWTSCLYFTGQNSDGSKKTDLRELWRFAINNADSNPNPFFDTRWYLQQYPDVAISSENPLVHYLQYGWKEGRDPGPDFSTNGYLAHNEDVREKGICPLEHYLLYGILEGRELKW